MSARMDDADRLALTQTAIDVLQHAWRERARIVKEVERDGRQVLTDAQDAEFRRLTEIILTMASGRWRPPVWACEEARQPVDGR
jgi:hypothetical protein